MKMEKITKIDLSDSIIEFPKIPIIQKFSSKILKEMVKNQDYYPEKFVISELIFEKKLKYKYKDKELTYPEFFEIKKQIITDYYDRFLKDTRKYTLLLSKTMDEEVSLYMMKDQKGGVAAYYCWSGRIWVIEDGVKEK